jgi:hypothetical protein
MDAHFPHFRTFRTYFELVANHSVSKGTYLRIRNQASKVVGFVGQRIQRKTAELR